MGHNNLFDRRSQHNRIAYDEEEIRQRNHVARAAENTNAFNPFNPNPTPTTTTPTNAASTTTQSVATTPTTAPITTPATASTSTTSSSTTTTTPTTTSTPGLIPLLSFPSISSIISTANSTVSSTSSTSLVTTTSSIFTPPVRSTTAPQTTFVTPTLSSTASATSTQTPDSSSGTNVGGIVGGIAGALLGLVALSFAVKFLMRRKSRHDDDNFNASDFRRSAILIDDPPTHAETVERGYNPRPPTMIERRLKSPAPTFGTQYGAPGPYGDPFSGNQYGGSMIPGGQYSQYPAYPPGMDTLSPGQIAYPNPAYVSPIVQPPPSPYASPYESGHHDSGEANPYLTRQPSANSQLSHGHPSRSPPPTEYTNQGADYVNLNRSSVTQHQATQYAEVSRAQHVVPAPSSFDQAAFLPTATSHLDFFSHDEEESYDKSPRINSNPPMLPAIDVAPRASAPSEEHDIGMAVSGDPQPTPTSRVQVEGHEANRATIYDDGDAYGGY